MTDPLDETKKLMAALGRMPPKPHSEMKLGKPKQKSGGSPKRKRSKRRLSSGASSKASDKLFEGFDFS
jgi:hypothetical protein